MTSESTRFLGQPRETKPILGFLAAGAGLLATGVDLSAAGAGLAGEMASSTPVVSVWEGGVTGFQFTSFWVFLLDPPLP